MYSKIAEARLVVSNKQWRNISTEELFDISEPPDYMCHTFEAVKNEVDECEDIVTKSQNLDDIEDLQQALSNAEYTISGTSHTISELNGQVDLLRKWGQQWKDLAKQLIEDNDINIEDYSSSYDMANSKGE